jgi:MoaA/NifB/PqqE/SkfB family radical SAM enzyme
MLEWRDNYNSFNSWKGLTYINQYKAIDEWRLNKRKAPLPPIEVSLDPIHACNLGCSHCNASRYLEDKDTKQRRMDDKHMMNLIKFLAKWGVKGICFGGGGEPSMHTKLADAILLARKLGVETSVATNGLIMTPELMKAYSQCRWVGISVDAANKETYMIGRKMDGFDKVTDNIRKLVQYIKSSHSKCDVAFKFLIFNYNQHEILSACKLAKELEVKDFHARPADFRHQGMTEQQQKNFYDIDNIEKQFSECHKLEQDYFNVFTVVHKFNPDFTPKRRFTQCYASPICIQLCANGNIYLCPDQRHVDFYKLGTHTNPKNILKLWGSKLHYDLVFKKGCSVCTSRCTFSPYNEQCERLAINKDDPMCVSFV